MKVTPERWHQIEAALTELLQTPSGGRHALLDRLSGSDPDLRQELLSLLAAAKTPDGFLDSSAAALAAAHLIEPEPAEQPGSIVGRYRLLEEIGRGGMGTVWLAERADGQFEQRVALKLIKRGMDSDEIVARFIRERQILARLEHPNIARLLDGGVSEDGRPYFVMELVEGRPITEFADSRQLPVEERLRLFAVACRAVGFAHRNLVVHRDIKPSNVLVGEDGSLKLLDFGIARLLSSDSAVTGRTDRLMTPEYASPEQTAGRQVTTASDIYQLGTLLYELLTGQRPTDRHRPSSAVGRSGELARSPDPTTRSEQRATTPDRLRRRLRGDLDAIVMRAMREEPESRHPSAGDLAVDVERHLADLPIRFGGDRLSYRAGKFVRRHRLAVAGTGAGLALVMGLLGYDAVRVREERDRARHEADKGLELSQLMARFLQGWSPDASNRGEVSARKLLQEAALRADRELQARPEMLAATLSMLGDFHTMLGDFAEADSLLGRAQTIQESLPGRSDADVALTLSRRGRLYRYTGRYAEAEVFSTRAIELDRRLFGLRHVETLRSRRDLARTYRDWKRPRQSEEILRSVVADLEATGQAGSPFGLETASELGYSLVAQARNDEAIAILRPALERQRALFGSVHASTLFTLRSLGSALRDSGELTEAEGLYREALRVSLSLYGLEHSETLGAYFVLALLLERRGKFAEAEAITLESEPAFKRVYGPDHYLRWYGYAHLGSLRLDRGDALGAERLLRLALATSKRAAPRGDPDQADILNRLAYLLLKRNAPDADTVYREAVEFDRLRGPDQPDFVTDGIHFLAWAELLKADSSAAEQSFRRALRIYEKQLPPSHPYLASARQGLAEATGHRGP